MSRQNYIEYIARMLERASEREARLIYHFMLHLNRIEEILKEDQT